MGAHHGRRSGCPADSALRSASTPVGSWWGVRTTTHSVWSPERNTSPCTCCPPTTLIRRDCSAAKPVTIPRNSVVASGSRAPMGCPFSSPRPDGAPRRSSTPRLRRPYRAPARIRCGEHPSRVGSGPAVPGCGRPAGRSRGLNRVRRRYPRITTPGGSAAHAALIVSGAFSARACSRSRARVLDRIRETCICETPRRSAIWVWVSESKNRHTST